MTTSSIGSAPSVMIKALVDMRAQFDDLQRQLSSGQKSDTYAGLGLGSGLSVGLNAQLSALDGYDNSIDTVMTRVNLGQQVLTSIASLSDSVRTGFVQANGSATQFSNLQTTAQSSLQQVLGLLNTQSGNRYLFSGRATDTPAVASYDVIMNGDGVRAGLKQIVAERNQADLGTNGLGRLSVSASGASGVAVQEDAGPFGFKLGAISSNAANVTVTGPTGSPPGAAVDFTGQPNDGENVTFNLTLPDGSTQALTFTATTNPTPGPGQFAIGATPADTAASLQNALATSLGTLAAGALKAASTVAATNDFFNADLNHPPQRVAGSPLGSATALVPGTAANTVIWYTGEAGSDSPRSTAAVRIDTSLVVSYGARANEQGVRDLVRSMAAIAAAAPPASGASGENFTQALGERLLPVLNGSSGGQTVADIQADLAGVQTAMNSMKSQHSNTRQTLTDMQQQITGVSNEQVGAELMKLQTQMQASMQTTAMLLQTSLVNYLK
jgi:flagellin-like hook-associated protein FlgL